jgi:hypothetical protein
MGFYLRKSVTVGPFRFNLSKSGLGLSVGVKGLRLGTGPRGNYVHMGRGGLYYRSALPGGGSSPRPSLTPNDSHAGEVSGTIRSFQDIDSADTVQLTDASSQDLVDQLTAKSKVARLFPIALILSMGVFGLLLYERVPDWMIAAAVPVAIMSWLVALRRDAVARAVVLMYDLDDAVSETYGRLHDAFDGMAASARVWHVRAAASVIDRKYHAGANEVVTRDVIYIRKGSPPILKTNVEAVLLPAGRQLLAFMPDRLLVFDRTAIAGVDYKNLDVVMTETRFIDDATPPADARIVGVTWRYVNKKGGPDRRFASNPQLPIALYEEIHLKSASGLSELFQCSRPNVGVKLREALSEIAAITRDASSPKPTAVRSQPSTSPSEQRG